MFYSQLLVSLAFGEVTWGIHGRSMTLLSKADGLSLSVDDKSKLLCYTWISYHKKVLKESGQDIPDDKAKPE